MVKKKNDRKKIVSVVLVSFLALMAVLTVVSRAINASYIPEVDTVNPASGTLKLSALGCGVVEFGQLADARLGEGVFTEDVFYVRGYFYEKAYTENVSVGDTVWLFVDGSTAVQGILAAKMYDYREDVVEVVIFPEEGNYTAGAEVDFVLENARVRCTCHIPNEVIYEDGDGGHYIYVLKTRESIVGNVTVAVKTSIHIVMQNETRSAIAEELALSTKIIKKDEVLSDGLKVREREW